MSSVVISLLTLIFSELLAQTCGQIHKTSYCRKSDCKILVVKLSFYDQNLTITF